MNNICIEIDDSIETDHVFGLDNVRIHEPTYGSDQQLAKQLDYQDNYTIPELRQIAEYYHISTRKLRKDELIQSLIMYETDPTHLRRYLKRLEGWYWMKELKKDSQLKQYIIF